jgi:hypothetical protein
MLIHLKPKKDELAPTSPPEEFSMHALIPATVKRTQSQFLRIQEDLCNWFSDTPDHLVGAGERVLRSRSDKTKARTNETAPPQLV